MKNTPYLIALFMIMTFSESCSKDDNDVIPTKEKTIPLEFTSLTASKIHSFVDEPILLTIEGSGFSEVSVVSGEADPSKVIISKIDTKHYKISALETLRPTIVHVSLDGELKSIDLNFYEHGVKNFNTVEGIQIGIDKKNLIEALLGEPEAIVASSSTSGDFEYWYYFTKGFYLFMDNSTEFPVYARVYGDFIWARTINDSVVFGSPYNYEIGNSWLLSGPSRILMNDVVDKYGPRDGESIAPSSSSKRYDYDSIRTYFYFFSDDIDNYNDKRVEYISVYR